ALHAADAALARAHFAESLALFREIGQRRGVVEAIAGLAAVEAQTGTPGGALRAARLWAAADAAHAVGGTRAWPPDRVERDRYEQLARTVVGSLAFDVAYAAGGAWSLEDAAAEALRTGSLP